MSKESTLKRIESDIASGDLGKARDRLNGLIRTYPDDINLRSRLAQLYSQLRYPHMAGCYWYLEEHQTDGIRCAIELFKKRCNNDPWVMWHWIKFKGDPNSITPYAKQKIDDLIDGCKKKYGIYMDCRGKRTQYIETSKKKWSNRIIGFGLLLALVVIILCAIIGFHTIVCWLL